MRAKWLEHFKPFLRNRPIDLGGDVSAAMKEFFSHTHFANVPFSSPRRQRDQDGTWAKT
jgi:hypothetical protein